MNVDAIILLTTSIHNIAFFVAEIQSHSQTMSYTDLEITFLLHSGQSETSVDTLMGGEGGGDFAPNESKKY